MAKNAILVQILGDASGFNKATKSATTGAQKFTNVLGGIGQGIGIAGFMGVANVASMAASAVLDFGKDSIKAASDHREAMSLVSQVFENSSGTVTAWSNAAAKSMGASSAAAMDMAAIFGTQFKKAGYSLDEVASKSIKMSELAGDLGSAFNKSSEEAATALRAGLLGEAEPMRKFGVTLSEAKVQAKAMAMGLVKAGEKMSDSAKIAARYAIIMEETADSQGMFGRDTDSAADAQKRLDATVVNLQADIGEGLVPVLADVATNLVYMVEGLGAAGDAANELLEPIGGLGAAWDTLLAGLTMGNSKLFEQAMAMKAAEEAAYDAAVASDTLDHSERTMVGTMGDVAAGAGEMAGEIKEATDSAKYSFDDMVDGFAEDAQRAITGAYDPIILRQDAMALNAEVAANEATLASKDSTDAQIEDARRALPELYKEQATYLTRLAETGQQGTAAYKDAMKSLNRQIKNSTGPTKAYLQSIKDAVNNIPTFKKLTFTVNIGGAQMSGIVVDPKARGGPASGLTMVGEEGPELLDLPGGSYVHSNPDTMRMMSDGSQGSPVGMGASKTVTINIGTFYGTDTNIEKLGDMLAKRMRTAPR